MDKLYEILLPVSTIWIDYLDASCIFNLYEVNQNWHQFVKKNIRDKCVLSKRINHKLETITNGSWNTSFRNYLQDSRAVVSGSFLLHCLTNPLNWYPNDIDVFLPSTNNILTYHDSKNEYYYIHQQNPIDVKKEFSSHLNLSDWKKTYVNYGGQILPINHIYTIPDFCKLSLQLITIDTEKMWLPEYNKNLTTKAILTKDSDHIDKFLIDYFDLNILKNSFDGKKLTIYHKQDIQYNSTSYTIPTYYDNNQYWILKRLHKYVNIREIPITNVSKMSRIVEGIEVEVWKVNNKATVVTVSKESALEIINLFVMETIRERSKSTYFGKRVNERNLLVNILDLVRPRFCSKFADIINEERFQRFENVLFDRYDQDVEMEEES